MGPAGFCTYRVFSARNRAIRVFVFEGTPASRIFLHQTPVFCENLQGPRGRRAAPTRRYLALTVTFTVLVVAPQVTFTLAVYFLPAFMPFLAVTLPDLVTVMYLLPEAFL